MKTSELTDAHLDYWVARAEGIPAAQLEIRPIQRSAKFHVVLEERDKIGATTGHRVLAYSTDWAQGGPLIEKHQLVIDWLHNGKAVCVYYANPEENIGATPLQAICRAVVRAAFGDEVEEVAVCE